MQFNLENIMSCFILGESKIINIDNIGLLVDQKVALPVGKIREFSSFEELIMKIKDVVQENGIMSPLCFIQVCYPKTKAKKYYNLADFLNKRVQFSDFTAFMALHNAIISLWVL